MFVSPCHNHWAETGSRVLCGTPGSPAWTTADWTPVLSGRKERIHPERVDIRIHADRSRLTDGHQAYEWVFKISTSDSVRNICNGGVVSFPSGTFYLIYDNRTLSLFQNQNFLCDIKGNDDDCCGFSSWVSALQSQYSLCELSFIKDGKRQN